MKFATALSRYVLFGIFAIAVFHPMLYAQSSEADINWDEANPSALHQKMADAKAQAHLDKELARSILSEAAPSEQGNYDVKFYDVYIRVNDTTEIIYGAVKFVVEATEDYVEQFQVDLYRTMSMDSVISEQYGTVPFTHLSDYVYVSPDTFLFTGEQMEFTMYYHGHPVEGGFQAFSFDTHNGAKVISSLSEPYFARTWWPCKDRMDDKPDSMYIAIEADTTYYVASNGTLDSVVAVSNNSHVYYWSVRYPITTYLFSVAISVYTVWDDYYYYNGGADSMLLTHAVYPDWYAYSLPRYALTPGMIGLFEQEFGPYPFIKEKYGHANFEWGGGMEHQTMTSMLGGSFGFAQYTVAHELSHQWWGDMITCKSWHDIWLNEGWASYAEAVWVLDQDGWDAYRSYMNGMAYTGSGTVWCNDTTSVDRIFSGGLSYDKGSWVVHMLRGVVGETLWRAGVDAYYNSEYQYAAASSEDFENVWEAATGMELGWYFEEWLYGTYRPNYYYYHMTQPSDSGGYDTYLVVKQVQTSSPQVFTMPVDFVFDYDGAPQDTLVRTVDQRQKLLKFHSSSDVTALALDPANWILKYRSERGWEMFIVSLPEEISSGQLDEAYLDTIEVLGGSPGDHVFNVLSGALPGGLTIDNNGVISGTPTDTGLFTFEVEVDDNVFTSYHDQATFSIYVQPPPCCGRYTGGYTGNTNCDIEGKRNLADISRLIDRVYLSKAELCCEDNGNVNGDIENKINLADISRLIDNVYISKSETAPCP